MANCAICDNHVTTRKYCLLVPVVESEPTKGDKRKAWKHEGKTLIAAAVGSEKREKEKRFVCLSHKEEEFKTFVDTLVEYPYELRFNPPLGGHNSKELQKKALEYLKNNEFEKA